jgi:peptidoglycan/LPS O-acetylase OafA/YrhL
MQFYFLFPLLARGFRKQPLLTYTLMTATAFVFRAYAKALPDCSMFFNQMPAFLDVFANGFLAASIYVSFKRNLKENVYSRIFFSICLIVCAIAITTLLKAQAGEMSVSAIRQGQMSRRYQFSLLISVVIISLPQSLGGIRLLFSNKGAKFLAGISYQFYIYHQLIAVWLKKSGIPPSAYENPNVQGDYLWQIKYIIICLFAAFAVSAVITYWFEKPLSKKLLKK